MAINVKQVNNPMLSFDLASTGVSHDMNYLSVMSDKIANTYQSLENNMIGISDEFTSRMNDMKSFFTNLDVIEEALESIGDLDKSIYAVVYDIDNYMDIPKEYQNVVMHDPFLRNEYEEGDIVGYNLDSDFDNTINEELFNGICDGDVSHDIILAPMTTYTGEEFDNIISTRTNIIDALLEDGEDLTDID